LCRGILIAAQDVGFYNQATPQTLRGTSGMQSERAIARRAKRQQNECEALKKERKIKREVIDLDLDEDVVEDISTKSVPCKKDVVEDIMEDVIEDVGDDDLQAVVIADTDMAIAPAHTKKEEVKHEMRIKARAERRAKAKKVKREKRGEDPQADARREGHKDGLRNRSRSGAKRRKKQRSRSRSSSSTYESSSESESELYRRFKPYTKVQLVNLVRKADLNGMCGQVVHPSTAVSPCPPGCILVRLETGREIAVKPPNIARMKAFHVGPMQAPQVQEKRLQQVLSQIKLNVDNIMERTTSVRDDGSGILMEDKHAVQGGIGHML